MRTELYNKRIDLNYHLWFFLNYYSVSICLKSIYKYPIKNLCFFITISLKKMTTYKEAVEQRVLRGKVDVSNNDRLVPRPNTNFYKKSFHNSATKVRNNLPLEIKKCRNVELFKKHCYNHFLENYMLVK